MMGFFFSHHTINRWIVVALAQEEGLNGSRKGAVIDPRLWSYRTLSRVNLDMCLDLFHTVSTL